MNIKLILLQLMESEVDEHIYENEDVFTNDNENFNRK